MIFTYIENTTYIEKIDKFIKIERKSQTAMQNFVEELRSMKICEHLNQNVNENPEDKYCRFARLVKSAKEKHLQPKIVKYNKTRQKKCCWMSYGILESINTKNRLYKRFIQTDKNNVALFDTLKAEYHIYRARLRRTIKEAKRMFYARTFLLYKNDMRKTWGVIRSNDTLQSNRRSKGQLEFNFGNRIIRDSDEIANHINDYFSNISRTLSQQIQHAHSFDHYLNGNVTSKFQFHSVSQDYIGKLIDTLKNKASYGHDNISNILIKRAKEVLIEPLALLVNQMLKSGHFPPELKISRVKPLFKKGDPSEFSNYRSIPQYHCFLLFLRYLNMLYFINYLIICVKIIYLLLSNSVFGEVMILLN